jgi:hypothetical protein
LFGGLKIIDGRRRRHGEVGTQEIRAQRHKGVFAGDFLDLLWKARSELSAVVIDQNSDRANEAILNQRKSVEGRGSGGCLRQRLEEGAHISEKSRQLPPHPLKLPHAIQKPPRIVSIVVELRPPAVLEVTSQDLDMGFGEFVAADGVFRHLQEAAEKAHMIEKRRSLDVQDVKDFGCRVRLLLKNGCPSWRLFYAASARQSPIEKASSLAAHQREETGRREEPSRQRPGRGRFEARAADGAQPVDRSRTSSRRISGTERRVSRHSVSQSGCQVAGRRIEPSCSPGAPTRHAQSRRARTP